MLPDSTFLPPTPVAVFDISDLSQFPPLNASKRPATDTISNSTVKCPRMSIQHCGDHEQNSDVEADPPLVIGKSVNENKNEYENELQKLKDELAEAKKAIDDIKGAQSNNDEFSKNVEDLKSAVLALERSKGNDLKIVDSYKNQLIRIDQGCLEVLESFSQRLKKVEEVLIKSRKGIDTSDETVEKETIGESDQPSHTCAVQ